MSNKTQEIVSKLSTLFHDELKEFLLHPDQEAFVERHMEFAHALILTSAKVLSTACVMKEEYETEFLINAYKERLDILTHDLMRQNKKAMEGLCVLFKGGVNAK